MKVKVIPVVGGAFGTVLNGLEKTAGIENQRKNLDHSSIKIG